MVSEILNPQYKMSHEGTKLLRDLEAVRLKAYKDPGSKDGLPITIGWGSTRDLNEQPFNLGDEITSAYAEELFRRDISDAERVVNKYVQIPLLQNEFDALVSFVYNIGEGQFAKSTLLKKLNQGDLIGAQKEFGKWIYNDGKVMNGLVTRRANEAKVFGTRVGEPVNIPAPIEESVPDIVNPGPAITPPKYDKIILVSNVFEAVKGGNKLANASTWKVRQNAINAIVAVLVGLIAMAKVFGFNVEVDDESLLAIGGVIWFAVSVFNGWATTATTADVGLQARSNSNGISSTGSGV